MADYQWPSNLAPYRVTFYAQPYSGGSESPLTRSSKIYGLGATRWVCRMRFRGGYDGSSGAAAFGPRLDAFIAKMRGRQNRVRLWDFRRPFPVGLRRYYEQFAGELFDFTGGETFTLGEHFVIPAEAEPTSESALAGATQIGFIGFLPGEAVFQYGDYFGVGGRIRIIVDDDPVVADGAGRAVVTFEPPLEADVLAGTATTLQPTSLFRLTSDDAGDNETPVGELSEYMLEFVEDLE